LSVNYLSFNQKDSKKGAGS